MNMEVNFELEFADRQYLSNLQMTLYVIFIKNYECEYGHYGLYISTYINFTWMNLLQYLWPRMDICGPESVKDKSIQRG